MEHETKLIKAQVYFGLAHVLVVTAVIILMFPLILNAANRHEYSCKKDYQCFASAFITDFTFNVAMIIPWCYTVITHW